MGDITEKIRGEIENFYDELLNFLGNHIGEEWERYYGLPQIHRSKRHTKDERWSMFCESLYNPDILVPFAKGINQIILMIGASRQETMLMLKSFEESKRRIIGNLCMSPETFMRKYLESQQRKYHHMEDYVTHHSTMPREEPPVEIVVRIASGKISKFIRDYMNTHYPEED